MRSLRELWRISKPLYYDLILGDIVSRRSGRNIERTARSVRVNALINKIIVSVFLVIVCVNSAMNGITDVLVFYLLAMFVVTFFFLHTMTTFVSKGFEILHTLPLSYDEIAKIRLFVFLRVFDVPLLIMTLAFPIAMLVFRGTFIVPLICILSVDAMAIYLSIRFARFFYEKITYSTSSFFSSLLRIITYLAWGFAVIGMYSVSSILNVLAELRNLDSIILKYDFVFPVNYAVISCGYADLNAIVTSIPFLLLSAYLVRSTLKEILREASLRFEVMTYSIRPSGRIMAFIKKDLRVITRNPGFTLVIMIPVIQGLIFGLTFHAERFLDQMILVTAAVGFLPVVAVILIGLENYDLLATLPVTNREITAAKSVLMFIIYIVSSAILVFRTNLLIPMTPAIVAMSVVSCKIAEEFGATRNIYVSAWKVLVVIIVAYLIVSIPMAFGLIAYLLGWNTTMWVAVPSIAEFLFSVMILAR